MPAPDTLAEQRTLTNSLPLSPFPSELAKATPASTSAPSKLDNLQVCIECDGLGQVKRWYNHMQLTQDCPTCKGEGIVERMKYKLVEKDDDGDAEGGVPPLEDI